MNNSPDNKLIVALDVQTAREARELFTLLRGVACMFKIGSQLFTSAGPQIVREIVEAGGRVFLDLKFHDIPNTVAAAGVEAARLGVSIFNVHAAGGSLMMHRTVEAVANVAAREGLKRPSVIAVTVLTSADDDALAEVGVSSGALGQVVRLARLAAACGLDGVVASPHEVSTIRAQVLQQDFLIVTPGVRPAGADADDQKRVMTPSDAVRAGADYIVMGRAILNASDPLSAAETILNEMKNALQAD